MRFSFEGYEKGISLCQIIRVKNKNRPLLQIIAVEYL